MFDPYKNPNIHWADFNPKHYPIVSNTFTTKTEAKLYIKKNCGTYPSLQYWIETYEGEPSVMHTNVQHVE